MAYFTPEEIDALTPEQIDMASTDPTPAQPSTPRTPITPNRSLVGSIDLGEIEALTPEQIDAVEPAMESHQQREQRIKEATWREMSGGQKLQSDISRAARGRGHAVAAGLKGVGLATEFAPMVIDPETLASYPLEERLEIMRQMQKEAAHRRTRSKEQLARDIEENPFTQGGKKVEADTERNYPAAQPESVTRPLGGLFEGLGNLAPSLATGALGIPTALLAGGSMELADAYEREMARQQQAGEPIDPEKAMAKAVPYALGASAIEAKLGLGRILGKIQKYFGTKVAAETGREVAKNGWKVGMDFAKERAKDFGAGFTEEASQRLLQDLIIEGDPDWQAILQEGLMGGGAQAVALGTAKGTAAAARKVSEAQQRRALGRKAQPGEIPPQFAPPDVAAVAAGTVRPGHSFIYAKPGTPPPAGPPPAPTTPAAPAPAVDSPEDQQGETFWTSATGEGRARLLGATEGTSRTWAELSDSEKHTVMVNTGVIKPMAPAATPQSPPTALPATMDTARRVVEMTPQEFFNSAGSFNRINLDIGKNATPEEYAELKTLRDRANQRLKEAMDAGRQEDIAILSSLPQFYNEAIQEYEKADPAKPPTPAQIEAGNYPKRKLAWNGLEIAIENEAGSIRRSKPDAKVKWEVKMPRAYGYFKRTEGKDGDQVDVYVGPSPESTTVYVIDQIDPDTGKFDEHKVMIGYLPDSAGMARADYAKAFSDGKGNARVGAITTMTADEFKTWLKEGDTKKALAYKQPSKPSKPKVETGPEVTLQSGRKVTIPVFKPITGDRSATARIKEVDLWLWNVASTDAIATKNEWMHQMIMGMTPDKLSPADRDMLNDYLFGNEKGINLQTGERIEKGGETDEKEGQGKGKQEVLTTKAPEQPAPTPPAKKPSVTDVLSDADKARLEELKKRLRDKLGGGQVGSGPDPSVIIDGAELAGIYIKAGTKRFALFARQMKDDMPEIWERLKGYLLGIWQSAAQTNPEIDDLTRAEAQKVIDDIDKGAPAADEPPPLPALAPSIAIGNWVGERLSRREPFKAQDLFDQADVAYGGTQAEGKYTVKDAYDALESGINRFIMGSPGRFTPNGDASWASAIVSDLRDMLNLVPTQSARTTESDKMQQFSTPPTLGFVANWVANPKPNDVMLEPSAGIGGLAVFSKIAGARVIANELSDRRRQVLKETEIADQITGENAEKLFAIYTPKIQSGEIPQPTVVVMNPPFSNAAKSGDTKNTMVGAEHVEQALKLLPPGGRLVAIVGEGMAMGKATFVPWWRKIGQQYNIRANIGVSGDEYRKYGTSFGNQLLVIDKTGPTPDLGKVVTGEVQKVQDLIPLLEGIRNDRRSVETTSRPPAQPGSVPTPGQGGGGRQPQPPASPQPGTGGSGTRPRPARPGAGGVRPQPGSSTPGVPPPAAGTAPGGGQVPPAGSATGVDDVDPEEAAAAGLTVEQLAEGKRKLKEAGVFSEYHPAKIKVPGSKPHPSPLVESTSMASVDPVDPNYSPKLPKETVTEGKVSDAQLENIIYAGQAHNKTLPTGERQGYFIGDGTGVGKGREIAGTIFDNWNQGRKKHVWISKNYNLMKDAKRDLAGVGFDPNLLIDMGVNGGKKIVDAKKGIAFLSYKGLSIENPGVDPNSIDHGQTPRPGVKPPKPPKLDKDGNPKVPKKPKAKSKSRMELLYDWLGPDFDGVIALDEVHLAGNAVDITGARGLKRASQAGRAVVDLQRLFPKARILYVSATGATDVSNLSYADRLGIWGHGTPFPRKQAFFDAIRAGGLSAMEIVARDLKALGKYLARTLSFAGVEQEQLLHELTPEQVRIYDQASEGWQVVLEQVEAALAQTGGNRNPGARNAARSAFFGAQQRFYNIMLTALQMPTVLKDMRKQLEDGNSIALQIVNTNESAMDREISKKAAEEGEDLDLESLDLSPKDILLHYIDNCFPTALYEPVMDSEGNIVYQPVLDANGTPVQDPEAVRMKQELMDRIALLAMPQNPLEMVTDTFGVDNVAEVTGRRRRVVQRQQEDGTVKRVIETNRSPEQRQLEADEYQDGKRRIIIFSNAGGTGFSFHSDKGAKNQQRRIHYLIQAGWRADEAIQGMGRTHRANQRVAPFYKLPSTNIRGHQRFLSTIARRLGELGALTSGERKAAERGLFDETSNLENRYAEDAVDVLFRQMFAGDVPGFDFGEMSRKLGYTRSSRDEHTGELVVTNTLVDRDGKLIDSRIPTIQQFLNRILVLPVAEQNAFFDEFMQRMTNIIAAAKENGTYDPGLQQLQALEIRKVSDEVVYSHPDSTARTRLVEIEHDHENVTWDWEDIDRIAGRDPVIMYVQNKRNGRVFALKEGPQRTEESGAIVQTFRRISPTGVDIVPEKEVRTYDVGDREANFLKLDSAAARNEWRQQVANAPKIRTDKDTYVVGTFLPIWDRLQMPSPRVWRIETKDGENLIGAYVPPRMIDDLRSRLGASAGSAMTPEQAFNQILRNNRVVKLANGWVLKRVRRSGENRIEVEGVQYEQQREFTQFLGGFMERIDFRPRFFIPTEEAAGVASLEKIFQKAPPVTERQDGDDQAQASLPTSPKEEIGEVDQRRVEASSIEEFRQMINSGEFGLPEQAKAITNAFLDSPVAKLLPEFWSAIQDTLQGGWQGSWMSGLLEIARTANPETGAHELSHVLWDILPAEIQEEFERLRVESINDLLSKPGNAAAISALEDLRDNPINGSQDWYDRDYPTGIWEDVYRYASAEEFFAHANSKHYQAKVGSKVEGFWPRVKEIWKGFMQGVRNMLRISGTLDERVSNWLTRIEAGDFTPTAETAREAEADAEERQMSLKTETDAQTAQETKASAGPTLADVEMKEEAEKAIEEAARRPEDQTEATTQVFGRIDRIISREGLTPETVTAGQNYTKQVMDELGINVVQDDSGRWRLEDENSPDDTAGIQLVQRLRQEIAAQEENGAAKGYLGNLLDSVVVNMTPDRVTAFSPETRADLYALAQGERSHRGLMLGSLSHLANSVEYVARNAGTILRRVYSDAFGGEQVGNTLDYVRELIRRQFTREEVQAVVGANRRLAEFISRILPGERAGMPTIDQIIHDVLNMPFRSQQHLADLFAEALVDRLGISQQDAQTASQLFSEAFNQKFAAARTAALRLAQQNLAPRMPRDRRGRALWSKIEQAVNAGVFDTGDILRRMAREYGWRIPSDRDLASLRNWVDEIQRLRELTPAEAARGITAVDKQASTLDRRVALKKQIETLWARLTHPLNYRTMQGASNIAAAVNEFTSANLLLRLSFAPKQLIDVLTQGGIHTPTRAVQAAIERWRTDRFAGREANLWREVGDALQQAYSQRLATVRASLSAARQAFTGTGEARNVDRLMSRIAIFERALQTADEASAQGNHAKAAVLRTFALLRLGYRIAQALDNIHGLPAEYQEMRQQVTTALRQNGQSRAEAIMNTDAVMGDMRAEWQLAIARAQEISEINGFNWTPRQVMDKAWTMVKARQYQRMREMGLPADDFEETNRVLRNTVGWNEREEGGLGGVVANTIARTSGLAQSVGLPLPLARFGNAIGTSINRTLSFTPMGFFPQAFEGSPWYRTTADRRQRKVEAAVGSAVGISLFLLAASGAIVVRLRWPRDKEERELWEREGHRPGTVEIPVGDGKFIVISTTTGPLGLVRPWLAAGGAIHDLATERAKAQAKLEAEALKKGVPAGKIRPIGVGEVMGLAASTAWGAVTGGRTASGLVGSVTDFGSFNPRKFASSVASPVVPGLPAYQEVARALGVQMDYKTASVMDFMVPTPWSKAAKVNMLGDPVGTEDGLNRVVQILTGGSSPIPVDPRDARQTSAYQALYETGYRPPSVNPAQGYSINGEYRPLDDAELEQYTQLRGQLFKEELMALGPSPSRKAVQAAYRRANEAALARVGVTRGRTGVNTPSATGGGGGVALSSPAGAFGHPPLVGQRISSPTRPRGIGSPRRRVSGGRRRSGRRALGRARISRGPSLRPRRISSGRLGRRSLGRRRRY